MGKRRSRRRPCEEKMGGESVEEKMEKRTPGLKACGGCQKVDECPASPYFAKAGEMLEEDWQNHNKLRCWSMHYGGEDSGEYMKTVQPDTWKFFQTGMPKNTAERFAQEIGKEIAIGEERVHRQMLQLIRNGTVKLVDREHASPAATECSGYKPWNHMPDHSRTEGKTNEPPRTEM